MPTMTILSLILVVLFAGATIWRTKELPESVSAMVYTLPTGGWQWLWTIWLVLVDIFTFAPAVEILDADGLGWLAFLPMAMIGFVAVWPLFDKEHRVWHYVLSILAGFISQVDVWQISPWCLLLWLLFVGWAWLCKRRGRASEFATYAVLAAEAVSYLAIIASEVV